MGRDACRAMVGARSVTPDAAQDDTHYLLGHTDHELRRLDIQGELYRDATLRAFRDAGIPGPSPTSEPTPTAQRTSPETKGPSRSRRPTSQPSWSRCLEHRRPGGSQVVVLGHGLWQRRYASDPGLVGRTINMDGSGHSAALGVALPYLACP